MTEIDKQPDHHLADRPRRWLREPLVHFLLIGVALFVLFEWLGGDSGPMSSRITLTQGQVRQLATAFTRTWQRPPTETELKGLVDEQVREEIAYREAVAMGLDRDDTIIRRRLRQKLEFLVEDAASATPPTDAELQAFLDAHPDGFHQEPQISLRQVYIDASRGGDTAARAQDLLQRLAKAGPDADLDGLGDPIMLGADLPLAPESDLARLFGNDFAARVMTLKPGSWQGPIMSGYGLHIVYVRQRADGRMPSLAEARPMVEREFLSQRRRDQLAAMYDELLKKYSVTIEVLAAKPGAGSEP
jgi:hypothetical protein